jgi:hypothetical protein
MRFDLPAVDLQVQDALDSLAHTMSGLDLSGLGDRRDDLHEVRTLDLADRLTTQRRQHMISDALLHRALVGLVVERRQFELQPLLTGCGEGHIRAAGLQLLLTQSSPCVCLSLRSEELGLPLAFDVEVDPPAVAEWDDARHVCNSPVLVVQYRLHNFAQGCTLDAQRGFTSIEKQRVLNPEVCTMRNVEQGLAEGVSATNPEKPSHFDLLLCNRTAQEVAP